MPDRRRHLAIPLALAILAGCTPPPVAPAGKGRPLAEATKAPALAPRAGTTRTVDVGAPAAELLGKVKLLSDHGVGVISNNTGGLIGNHGSAVIAENGSGIIAEHGSGIISKVKYALTGAGDEAPLAEATIEVLDATGARLVDAAGKPITATTDATGAYKLAAKLPDETLVLRVVLHEGGLLAGGALLALLPRRGKDATPADLDTASSLGASYVLTTFVQGKQEILDRLPAAEAAALRQAVAAALDKAGGKAPDYHEAAQSASVASLAKGDPSLGQTLGRIEAVLLVGQQNLGSGLPATSVAVSTPAELAGDGRGNLFVVEGYLGRIRRVDMTQPGNPIRMYADAASGDIKVAFAGILDAEVGPDGALYVVEHGSSRVRRITAAGQIEPVAGNDFEGGNGPVGGKATETALNPYALAFGPDGTLYIGEEGKNGKSDRLVAVDKAGMLSEVPTPAELMTGAATRALAVTPDGAIWLAMARQRRSPGNQLVYEGRLLRRPPGGGAWLLVGADFQLERFTDLAAAPDHGVYLSEDLGHRVVHVAADGKRTVVAGTGRGGSAGDGGKAVDAQLNQPSGLWLDGKGALFVADYGNGLVRRVDLAAGTLSTVAGTSGLVQQGDVGSLAINNPGGVAVDPQGRLVITEVGSNTIKRLDGRNLTVLAGSTRGFGGDGGPATEARFTEPAGVVYVGDTLYVADAGNERIRAIGPDGTVRTVAGNGGTEQRQAPFDRSPSDPFVDIGSPVWIAADAAGRPVWTVRAAHQVQGMDAAGMVRVLAGRVVDRENKAAGADAGDGGLATAARLDNPMGIARNARGELVVADAVNFRVRAIGRDGTIRTIAGLPKLDSLGRLLSNSFEAAEGADALTSPLAFPTALCFDADDNLYVAEVGTTNLARLGVGYEGVDLGSLAKIPARIRKITPAGKITTVAGPGGKVLTDAGAQGALTLPLGLAVDLEGRLIISDAAQNQVKLIPKAAL